jgi:hypothetical protein
MRKTILMLSMFAVGAGAQVPAMAPGSRLKVEMTDRPKVEGTLMSQTPDSLVIAANGALITAVPTANVGRISSTMGRSHGAGAWKGTKIGVMVGGGLGVLAGLAVMTDNSLDNASEAPLFFGLLGAAEGAFYGVIIGAIAGSQDWKPVYERPYRVTLAPAPGSVRLGLSYKF